MRADPNLRLAHALAVALPALLLGGAYVSQYGFGLHPCEMCWWQRWPHFAAVALALVGYVLKPRWLFVALAAGGILTSGLIGGFHAGVEYGWWEGLTSCSTTAAPAPGADPMDAIMNAPLIRCDVAPWSMFGISLAGWNFLVSTLGALAIFTLLAKRDRVAR